MGMLSSVAAVKVKPATRLLSARLLSKSDIDGRLVSGPGANHYEKLHLLPRRGAKPFPTKTGSPVLVGEDEPHKVNDFSGLIGEGRGKGMKKLLYKEDIVLKVGDRLSVAKANIHQHDAEVAGRHWDFVAVGIKPGTREFDFNIPRGEFKGSYSVRRPEGMEKGRGLLVRMKDRGVMVPKPKAALKALEWLASLDPKGVIVERKMDGSMASMAIESTSREGLERAIFQSWRDVPCYTFKLPALEWLQNRSHVLLDRLLFKPEMHGTLFRVELFHKDGASRLGGLLNSGADKAIGYQREHGPIEAYVTDILKYKGKNVSNLPYSERRAMMEEAVAGIRPFNKHVHIVERKPGWMPLEAYYELVVNDPRGLPWSEGIMVKPVDGRAIDLVYKGKARDTIDVEVLDFIEGAGKYKGTLGGILVQPLDVRTGSGVGEIGSFAIPDEYRDWMWRNRDLLKGDVAEVTTQGRGPTGAILKGNFIRFHPSQSEAGLLMYSERLAGTTSQKEARGMLYALKTSAGWKRK
jgi:hypothetical protein